VVTEKLYHPVEVGTVLASCLGHVINPIGRELWDYGRDGTEEISDSSCPLDIWEVDLRALMIYLLPVVKPVIEVLTLWSYLYLLVLLGKFEFTELIGWLESLL
jgi:hypothetical protein